MPNPFVWVELHTGDAEKAKMFYTDLLGWKFQPMGDMPYSVILGDQGGVGGITASPNDHTRFRIYFQSPLAAGHNEGWDSGESTVSPPQLIVQYQ